MDWTAYLAKSIAVATEELPKAALAALIPFAQLAWRSFEGMRLEGRKARLRRQMGDLARFLADFRQVDQASSEVVRLDAERELAGLNGRYATVVAKEAARDEARRPEHRQWWQIALLLYVPAHRQLWFFFALFWLCLALLAFALLRAAHNPSAWIAAGALAFPWLLARRREQALLLAPPYTMVQYQLFRPPFRRLLLLFGPAGVWHLAFHLSLGMCLQVAVIDNNRGLWLAFVPVMLLFHSIAISEDVIRFAEGKAEEAAASRWWVSVALAWALALTHSLELSFGPTVVVFFVLVVAAGVTVGLHKRAARPDPSRPQATP